MRAAIAVSHAAYDKTPPAQAWSLGVGVGAIVRFGIIDFHVPDMAAADHLAAAINRVYGLEAKQEAAA